MQTTNYVKNWIKRVDYAVEYWRKNPKKLDTWQKFINDKNTYSNLITSCVAQRNSHKLTPKEYQIDINSFPEPYYGNPDDSIEKTAVVLFYNPGGSNFHLFRSAQGKGTFFTKYYNNKLSYSKLSSLPGFKGFIGPVSKKNTLTHFIAPKKNSLHKILNNCGMSPVTGEPFFLDLVPWHSEKFGLFDMKLFKQNAFRQALQNVFIPAILNANNSLFSYEARARSKGKNIIVFFCVGALYSKVGKNSGILEVCGFKDVTSGISLIKNKVPIPYTMITRAGDLTFDTSSFLRVWKISWGYLKTRLSGDTIDSEFFSNLDDTLSDVTEIYAINVWNRNPGMTIPANLDSTINEILNQLKNL
jgi:hypothetical protein